jgi:hypothetical protein
LSDGTLLEDCDFMQHRTRVSVTRLREMGLVGNDEDVTSLGGAGFNEDDSSEEELARDERRLKRANSRGTDYKCIFVVRRSLTLARE